jgi:UDP:flavonoid glycosyltransferase YjiC (YdhE family)
MVTPSAAVKRILIVAYPYGGSHAQRCLSVGQELSEGYEDIEPVYASGGPTVAMLRKGGAPVEDVLRYEPIPVVDGSLDRSRMRGSFARCELQHAFQVLRLIRRYRPAAVVLDEMILPVLVARLFAPKLIYLTHAPVFPSPPIRAGIVEFLSNGAVNAVRRLAILATDVAFYMGSREHLPDRRSWPWVEQHTRVVDVLRTKRSMSPTLEQARQLLGVPAEAPLVVVTVGNTNMGGYLLQTAVDALPLLTIPDTRLLLICGESIDPASIDSGISPQIQVVPSVTDLTVYLAAADAAVIHAGTTTIRECAALGTPMICIPIQWHREQENNARHAAEVFGGRVITRDQLTAGRLAAEIVALLSERTHPSSWNASRRSRVRLDHGRVEAAQVIADLLGLERKNLSEQLG